MTPDTGDIVIDSMGRMLRVVEVGEKLKCIPFVREAFRLPGDRYSDRDDHTYVDKENVTGVIKCW